MTTKTRKSILPALLLVAAIVVVRVWFADDDGIVATALESAGSGAAVSTAVGTGDALIADAFREGRSGILVETVGTVSRSLPDDNEGSPHQRFIVELMSGDTLLVAHNIELAPRVPLGVGDEVQLKGQYEWNERGGVLHWTHHDPAGVHPGGWIRHAGKTYE